jgi:hypothetical protein
MLERCFDRDRLASGKWIGGYVHSSGLMGGAVLSCRLAFAAEGSLNFER